MNVDKRVSGATIVEEIEVFAVLIEYLVSDRIFSLFTKEIVELGITCSVTNDSLVAEISSLITGDY